MTPKFRARLMHLMDDLMLWGWRSPGRGCVLVIGMGCFTTLLILLGHVFGSWLGGWIGELGAVLGMLVGAWSGLVAGTVLAARVGVLFDHQCGL